MLVFTKLVCWKSQIEKAVAVVYFFFLQKCIKYMDWGKLVSQIFIENRLQSFSLSKSIQVTLIVSWDLRKLSGWIARW